VGNFAQGFSPEGVAFDIFFVKMSNPHPLPDPPSLGVNIDRCIIWRHVSWVHNPVYMRLLRQAGLPKQTTSLTAINRIV
jgi:hypothetical protein